MPKKRIPIKTELLQVRIAPDKLDGYRTAAVAEGRTLSNWVEWHLDGARLRVPTSARLSSRNRKTGGT